MFDDNQAEVKSKQLLLVEDDALTALDRVMMLEENGFQVLHAFRGGQALRFLEEERVDLILMDIDLGLKEASGIELAQAILKERELPIVFHTNHAEEEVVRSVRNITSYGYVIKSSGDFVLLESIRMALSLFEAQRRAFRNAERYRNLIDHMPYAIAELDKDEEIVTINRAMAQGLGGTRDELRGRRLSSLLPPDIAEKRRQQGLRVLKTGQRAVFTDKLDGRTYHHLVLPMQADGERHVQIIVQDITERIALEEELKEREADYRLLVENQNDLVVKVDLQGHFLFVSPSYCELFGLEPREVLGKPFLPLVHPDDREETRRAMEDLYRPPYRCYLEQRAWTVEGWRWLAWSDRAVLDLRGNLTAVIGVGRDVTRRKEMERQLEQALAAKDLLIREMNHRIKNNLALIQSFIRLKSRTDEHKGPYHELGTRIEAVRLIHEKLYQGALTGRIELGIYIPDLIEAIFTNLSPVEVYPEIDVMDLQVPAEIAVSLGFVISEIAVNALQHAYEIDGTGPRRFWVRMSDAGESYSLRIGNNGRPYSEGGECPGAGSFGVALIESLVKQLGGGVELDKIPHTEYAVSIPKREVHKED